jgi:excisionase family DNA binding protein
LDRLLTVEEAAERLSTSTRFVRRLVAERRIAYVKVGRHVRLDPGEVEAFIVASRVETLSTWPASTGDWPTGLAPGPNRRRPPTLPPS